jgi:phage FluMu protein Com
VIYRGKTTPSNPAWLKWTYRGQEHSYLNAECPSGRFVNQIEVAYGDGTNLHGSLLNSCQSKG